MKLLTVAVGGSLGAVTRYLVGLLPMPATVGGFPLSTFVINITGCFFIGLLAVVLADRSGMSEYLRLALMVGFLGAFTTFSAYELELYDLITEQLVWTAVIYAAGSVIVGFVAAAAGVMAGRRI